MNIARLILSGVVLAASITAVAETPTIHRYSLDHGGFFSNMSPNGHWAVGNPPAGDPYTKVDIVDIRNGKVVTLPIKTFYNKQGEVESVVPTVGNVQAGAVNNDGTIVAGSINGEPGYWQDNAWHQLPFPNDRRKDQYFGYEAEVQNMRADGKYMVGMAYDASFNILPLLWIDGELVDLPNLPTQDWKGYEIGAEQYAANMRFVDITEDGKYLLGGMSTNHPGWGSCYFLYNMDSKSWFFLGTDLLNEMIATGNYFDKSELTGDEMPSFSPNGRYIAGNALLSKNNGSPYPTDEYRPWIYDIQNDEFKIFMDDIDNNKLVTGITDDGQLIASSSFSQAVTSIQFRTESMWIDLEAILSQNYNVDITKICDMEATGVCFGISDDCRTLIAMPQPCRTNGYSVSLSDKSFFEASKGVNLMEGYRISPVDNSKITTLDKVMVRFNRPSEVVEDFKAAIKDGDKEIAASTSVEAYNADKLIWVIKFDPITFEEGKNYTVVIPEGSFYLPESPAMKNVEITANYIGKKNDPVSVVNISPASGSAVPELGVENLIRIRFNSPVQTAPNAVGQLYQKGASSPMCNLILAADGTNFISAYPAATRKLMLGTDYEVRIPAGSVLDVTGYCPSEEITVEYSGTSEISAPDPGSAYLFMDNFDDPEQSLNNFMQYEGDHNMPSPAMESLGFDADNTPWNFSVRQDSESSDYVAASHSSYTNGGKSDDWLVLPQLEIQNPFIVLSFDAQNYKKSASDRLKVLVWANDESFSSLDAEIINRMREGADVVLDHQLTPGDNEDTFDGDWEHFEIPLEKYAGSKIYIAFLNDNENQSAIFLNDLSVVYKGNFQVTADYSENVVDAENTQIRAYINVLNEGDYRGFTAKLTSGNFESTYTDSDVHIEKGKPFGFHFPENLPLVKGETTNFTIEVTMGDETQTVTGAVNDLLKYYFRRVVLEEGTGAWCGNCPLGTLAIEDLEKIYGDRFIPISIHNDDEYAYPAYESFLGFSAFPTGRIDRMPEYLAANNGMSFYKDGKTTFHDVATAHMEQPAMLDVWVSDVEKSSNGSELSITTNAVFGISQTDKHYNVLAVLTEDDLPGVQANYLSGSSDPFVGDWGARGSHCDVLYADVARAISGTSFYGEGGAIPTTIVAGEKYSHTLKLTVPSSVKDLEKCRVTTMVIDPTTGYIVNAFRTAHLDAGIEDVIADSSRIMISFADGRFLANGSADGVEVYNLAGMRVNNNSLAQGLYLVVAKSHNGEVVKAKMMVK